MTALLVRQNMVTVVTTATLTGTAANPVVTSHYFHPDQIPFESTPALIATCTDEDEHFTTLGASHAESMITIELEYLDAPIQGDDLQTQMAAVEAWFEQAKQNLRKNSTGKLGSTPSWAWLQRMRTKIDKPLSDQGRVFYHGCLYVTVKENIG